MRFKVGDQFEVIYNDHRTFAQGEIVVAEDVDSYNGVKFEGDKGYWGICPGWFKPLEGKLVEPSKGAAKDNKKDCKPDYALLPKAFMDQVAFVMMAGEAKYGRFNYCLGHEITQITAAQCRHAKLIEQGEDIDWDTTSKLRNIYPNAPEITHLACIAAGSLMALHQKELGTLKDERYKK